jgi:hypothetical protein
MAANQGSRAGLITTVVVMSIVSVVAIIFAFWYGAEKRKVEADVTDLKKQYSDLISPAAFSGPEITDLKALRQDPNSGYTRDMKVWDVAVGQRDQLVKLVTGKDAGRDNSAQAALKLANDKVKALAADEKLKSSGANVIDNDLIGTLDVMADKVRGQVDTIADRDAKLAEAEKRALDAIKQKDDDIAAKDKQVETIRAEADQAIKDATEDRSKQGGVLSDIEKNRQTERQTLQDTVAKREVELKTREQQLKAAQDRIATLQAKTERFRIDPTTPAIRRGDAVISNIASKDIVYINLGRGRQIVPGMTFEVYDKNRGIPKLAENVAADEQPAGKASVEVVRVLDDASECRVTRMALGQQLMQGDIVLNVVYDPNTKYNFYVFGRFDLDRNGVATAQDTETVKRLIGQWGGNMSTKISPDTDFVVVGPEPVLPNYTPEELTDPINLKKQTDAQAELDQYLNVIQQAKDLHIPVLNQNRFLYLTGQENMVTR